MGVTASFDTLLDAVVFLIPITGLLTLVVLLLRRRRSVPPASTRRATVSTGPSRRDAGVTSRAAG